MMNNDVKKMMTMRIPMKRSITWSCPMTRNWNVVDDAVKMTINPLEIDKK